MVSKYYIKTFGCQMNVSDSERIAGFLEAQPHLDPLLIKERGFNPTKDIKKADLVIFNTCGVRQMAEDRVYGLVHNLRKTNSKVKIIVTGCLADRKDVQRKLKEKVDLFFPIKEFEVFESWIIENLLKISTSPVGVQFIEPENKKTNPGFDKSNPYKSYLCLAPKYSSKQTAYVPVMTGCNNFCSYCVVPYARGREVSRSAQDIISEIDTLAKNGCREITLLGQNVNSYKYRLSFPRRRESSVKTKIAQKTKRKDWIPAFAGMTEVNFPALINILAKTYPQMNWRFLTSHPKDFSEKLMRVIAARKNINREIHLPVQSGSDKILKAMNRPYTRKHYLSLIAKAKKIIPGASFTTDVIVGFPGETEKDFEATVKVFKKVKYNEAYINKYSPRPGTAAFKLGDPIEWEEKKRRERILRDLVK